MKMYMNWVFCEKRNTGSRNQEPDWLPIGCRWKRGGKMGLLREGRFSVVPWVNVFPPGVWTINSETVCISELDKYANILEIIRARTFFTIGEKCYKEKGNTKINCEVWNQILWVYLFVSPQVLDNSRVSDTPKIKQTIKRNQDVGEPRME